MFKDKERRATYLRQYRADHRDKMNTYLREWRDRRRQEAITLLGGACIRCGSTADLHFDHINRTTKQDAMANLWNSPEDVRLAELAKCQLLCNSCHHLKTKEAGDQAQNPGHHGAGYMYQVHKCRCVACVAWKQADGKARYRRRRELAGLPYQPQPAKPRES